MKLSIRAREDNIDGEIAAARRTRREPWAFINEEYQVPTDVTVGKRFYTLTSVTGPLREQSNRFACKSKVRASTHRLAGGVFPMITVARDRRRSKGGKAVDAVVYDKETTLARANISLIQSYESSLEVPLRPLRGPLHRRCNDRQRLRRLPRRLLQLR